MFCILLLKVCVQLMINMVGLSSQINNRIIRRKVQQELICEVRIIFSTISDTTPQLFGILMFSGSSLLIACGFILIKMNQFLPTLIWLAALLVACSIILVIIVLLHPAALLCDKSGRIITDGKDILKCRLTLLERKYQRAKLKSCYPIVINVGVPGFNFYSIRTSTNLTFSSFIVYHTINAIISIPYSWLNYKVI